MSTPFPGVLRSTIPLLALTGTTALLLLASLLAPADVTRATHSTAATDGERPDIVLVVTDDQRLETLAAMPQVQRQLVDKGTRFSHGMVPTAVCCPSRSSILTGLYSHHTRVYGNGRVGGGAFGGWTQFHRRGMESRTVAAALDSVGYRTGLFGKYLNDFNRYAPIGYRPPGWDEFLVFAAPSTEAYYMYWLSDGTWHGFEPDDYSTDVLAARAREFVRSTPANQPLFLLYAPFAPHWPYLSARRHDLTPIDVPATHSERAGMADLLPRADGVWPRPPRLPALPDWAVRRHMRERGEIDVVASAQTRTLLSVDEAVGSLVETMRATGRVRNTLFVFMSDNGYLWGEHGMVGKDVPYAPATRVPLVVRWDGRVPAGAVDGRLALNVDIAGTLARAAGVRMTTDGLDLLGRTRRKGFVLEGMIGKVARPPYCGWRTRHRMYVRWGSGEAELYDYRLDPGERFNFAGLRSYRSVENRMRARAVRACRPEPPGFDW